jgi:hypothetical protein
MPNRPTPQSDKPKDTKAGQVDETRLKSAGEVVVERHDTPPPGPPDKRIHSRRPLPPVPATRPRPQPQEDSTSDQHQDQDKDEP